ncbi:MAG: leucine-rich repeat protein [Metamycoplasmataceae bacterium]
MKIKKILLTNLALVSIITSPLIILTSCSDSSNNLVKKTIEEFIADNQNNLIVPGNNSVRDFPAQLYIDNPDTSLENFKINDELQEILDEVSIEATFSYSDTRPSVNTIRFELIFFQNGKTILEAQSEISGFINRTEYISKSRDYLQSLNLNASLQNEYSLKEFLELFLPEPGNQNEWYDLLDFKVPWGFEIELNNDIKSSRYDSNNQKFVIGKFIQTIGTNEIFKEDVSISITNNFRSPNIPLFVMVVDDNGIDKIDISAETLFINRTNNEIIKFNQKLDNTAIYGELDFSSFNDWELPLNDGNGIFQGNFITSVKLPKNTNELIPKLFLNNKILNFDTNNLITYISDNSFDPNVKYGNTLIDQLGLRLYYDPENKTLDFTKHNVDSLSKLLELLQLVSRNEQLLIDNIVIPSELFDSTRVVPETDIRNINNLKIKINRLIFSSQNKLTLNNLLSFSGWTINNVIIPREIISLNISSIKASTNRIIERELHPDIKALVLNGVLDLRNSNTINELLNYENNKNLNNYFDVNNSDDNLIHSLYLENSDTPTFSNFDLIFKKQAISKTNKIYISSNTLKIPNNLINTINFLELQVEREIPNNLNIENNHLILNDSSIFIKDFNLNIMYLNTINEITLPNQTWKIPENAFKDIDLSNVILNYNKDLITEIENNAFNNSKLTGHLEFPNLLQIGSSSFSNNEIASVDLPLVRVIGFSAFNNNKISEINLPNVEIIPNSAFSNNLLTNINLPKATTINNAAFFSNLLSTINLPNVTTIGNQAFSRNNLTSIFIPEIAFIGSSSFTLNPDLSLVRLSSEVVINNNSFDSHTIIEIEDQDLLIPNLFMENGEGEITIDFDVIIQGGYNFITAINQINLQLRDTNKIIDNLIWNPDILIASSFTFFNFSNIRWIKTLSILETPNLTKIADNLFNGIRIDEVIGLDHVSEIGAGAFRNSQISKFNGIEGTLTLNHTLVELGANAFNNNNISTLNIEIGSRFSIPIGAFVGNRNLTIVNIPRTLKKVSTFAFDANVWSRVQRAVYTPNSEEQKEWPWEYNVGTKELIFKELVRGEVAIKENIETLNGLEIRKISFTNNIHLIPQFFLNDLVNYWSITEVDLSTILVIEANAFKSPNYEIKPGSALNIVYNDINSGITYNFK